MDDNNTVTIYFENGKTAVFERVTDFEVNENNTLTFYHVDAHSQIKCIAGFSLDVIAGFSTIDD